MFDDLSFSQRLGMSSSQLTFTHIFFRWVGFFHQPDELLSLALFLITFFWRVKREQVMGGRLGLQLNSEFISPSVDRIHGDRSNGQALIQITMDETNMLSKNIWKMVVSHGDLW